MSENERTRRPLTRSPNYPAIDIGRAIDRVRTLYGIERQHLTPATQAVKHWGYSTLNSPGGGQLAALARFGLIEDEGTKDDRKVRVTDLAVKILEHPDPAERDAGVREAAMLPAVHQDMWQTYGADLPSEDNLRWFLTRERGFSENGAKDFLKEYRATIDFAKLDSEPAQTPTARAQNDLEEAPVPNPVDDSIQPAPAISAPVAVPVGQTPPISFPLASGKIVSVSGLGDLAEGEWAQFMAVLTALKPSLVRAQPGAGSPDADGGIQQE